MCLGLALRLELVQVREHRVELLPGRGVVLLVVEERRLLGLHLIAVLILRLMTHERKGRGKVTNLIIPTYIFLTNLT